MNDRDERTERQERRRRVEALARRAARGERLFAGDDRPAPAGLAALASLSAPPGSGVVSLEKYSLACRLALARERAGLSRKALARRARVSVNGLSQWEAGVRRPTLPILVALAAALGLDRDGFADLAGYGGAA